MYDTRVFGFTGNSRSLHFRTILCFIVLIGHKSIMSTKGEPITLHVHIYICMILMSMHEYCDVLFCKIIFRYDGKRAISDPKGIRFGKGR